MQLIYELSEAHLAAAKPGTCFVVRSIWGRTFTELESTHILTLKDQLAKQELVVDAVWHQPLGDYGLASFQRSLVKAKQLGSNKIIVASDWLFTGLDETQQRLAELGQLCSAYNIALTLAIDTTKSVNQPSFLARAIRVDNCGCLLYADQPGMYQSHWVLFKRICDFVVCPSKLTPDLHKIKSDTGFQGKYIVTGDNVLGEPRGSE